MNDQILTSRSEEDWKKKKKKKESESDYFWNLRRVSFLTGSGDIWTCSGNERTCFSLVWYAIINQT